VIASVSGLAGATPAQAAIVPNFFVRDCSYVTRHCTGWWQTNGRYNPAVPSTWTTRWTWRWIW
jgi:hypothetical protein